LKALSSSAVVRKYVVSTNPLGLEDMYLLLGATPLDRNGMTQNASAGRNAAHFHVAIQDNIMRRIVALCVFCGGQRFVCAPCVRFNSSKAF
jgi:hypothetical protein